MIGTERDILSCIQTLQAGGLIQFPTQLGWSIGCDATNIESIARLDSLRLQPVKPLRIVFVTEEQDILRHVAAPDLSLFDFLKSRTEPTAVSFEGVIGLADALTDSDGRVIMYITPDPLCRHIIKRFGKPLVTQLIDLADSSGPIQWEGIDFTRSDRQLSEPPSTILSIIRWESGTPVFIRP